MSGRRPTRTQLLVLECAAEGLTTGEAARRLGLARSTTRVHLRDVRRRLKVDSTEDAIRVCLRRGWLPVPVAEVDSPLPPALELYLRAFDASRPPHEPTRVQRAGMAAALRAHRARLSASGGNSDPDGLPADHRR